MEDKKIIELFFARNEAAIVQITSKYSGYLGFIAHNILGDNEDTEECLNDAYLKAWNAIPPACPESLKMYLAKVTRNTAIDMFEKKNAQKRGGGETDICLEEISECISDKLIDKVVESREIAAIINEYLGEIAQNDRKIFVRRYWYLDSILVIAKLYHLSEANVKTKLFRMRNELKAKLEEEGIEI